MVNMNWKDSKSDAREVYPTGTYGVKCTKWEHCVAKKGTPQIRVFTKITEGEYEGKTLVDHVPVIEKTLWKVANLVDAFGISFEGLPEMEVGGEAWNKVVDAIVGKKAYWRIIEDEQYGNNKVEEYKSVEGVTPVVPEIKLDDDDCPFE